MGASKKIDIHDGGRAPGAPRVLEQRDWRPQGLCHDNPDMWTDQHPTDSHKQCDHGLARHICEAHCPVQLECAKESGETPDQWVGMVIGGLYWRFIRKVGTVPAPSQPNPNPGDWCRFCAVTFSRYGAKVADTSPLADEPKPVTA